MDHRADDAGHQIFVRLGGPGRGLVSREAMRLHVFAVLASLEAGHPGYVTDDYLDAVAAETSVPALELCTADLWSRVDGGYEVLASETLRMASEVHRQLEALSARCRASGGHTPDPDHPGLCRKCAVRLDV